MGGGCWLTFTRTFEAVNASPAPAEIDRGQSSLAWLVAWLSKWAGSLAGGWSRDPCDGAFPRGGMLMGNDIFGALVWIRPSHLEALGGADRSCFCQMLTCLLGMFPRLCLVTVRSATER